MIGSIREASEAFRETPGGGADTERLSALEGRMEVVLGMVEAGITKAEALKLTARAAEDRARGHLRRAENYAELVQSSEAGEEADPFESAARAFTNDLPSGNDEGIEGMPPMPHGVGEAGSDIARAKAAKRGII